MQLLCSECYTNALLEHCGCYLFTQYWAEGFGKECTAEEMQDCASGYLIAVQQNVGNGDNISNRSSHIAGIYRY